MGLRLTRALNDPWLERVPETKAECLAMYGAWKLPSKDSLPGYAHEQQRTTGSCQ